MYYPRDHLHEKTAIKGKSLQSSRIAHATYNLQLVGYYPQESVHLGETLHSPAQLSWQLPLEERMMTTWVDWQCGLLQSVLRVPIFDCNNRLWILRVFCIFVSHLIVHCLTYRSTHAVHHSHSAGFYATWNIRGCGWPGELILIVFSLSLSNACLSSEISTITMLKKYNCRSNFFCFVFFSKRLLLSSRIIKDEEIFQGWTVVDLPGYQFQDPCPPLMRKVRSF